jgi:tetratricopeptide (TPR) repeat protein
MIAGDRFKIVDGEGKTAAILNADANYLFSRCDGARTTEEISASIKSKLNLDEDHKQLLRRVKETVQYLSTCGLVELRSRPNFQIARQGAEARLARILPTETSSETSFAFGAVHALADDNETALFFWRDLDLIQLNSTSAIFQVIRVLVERGELELAIERLSSFTCKSGSDQASQLRLIRSACSLARESGLRELSVKAGQLGIDCATRYGRAEALVVMLFELSLCLLECGDAAKATDMLSTALALSCKSQVNPKERSRIVAALASTKAWMGDPGHALSFLQDEFSQSANTTDYWLILGDVLIQLNRVPHAMTAHQLAFSSSDRTVKALTKRGEVWWHLGQIEFAYSLFDQAMIMAPTNEIVSGYRRETGRILEQLSEIN